MPNKINFSEKQLKQLQKSVEVFNFWFRVLSETKHMDCVENRKEYLAALQDLENIIEKNKVD